MTLRRWLGAAKQTMQVDSMTVAGTWLAGEKITFTIANLDVTVTVGSLVTTAQVATTIVEAWEALGFTDTTAVCDPTIANGGLKSVPQFSEIAAAVDTVNTSKVIFSARTPGKPYTMTSTENSVSGTAPLVSVTVSNGKWYWDEPDNWSGNAVPVNSDDVLFDSGDVDCLFTNYGATPANNLITGVAIQPLTFTQTSGYSGSLGLSPVNRDNASKPYSEYRGLSLTFTNNAITTTLKFGETTGVGSRRMNMDSGAGRVTGLVLNTGTRSETSYPTLLWKGSHVSNDWTAEQGDLGIAYLPGETATVATLRVGTETNASAKCYCGSGVTLTTVLTAGSGKLTLNSSPTTLTMSGLNSEVEQLAGVPASANIWSGVFRFRSVTTLPTALSIGPTGKLDRTGEARAATITPVVQMYEGATLLDPNSSLVFSGGIKVVGGKLGKVTIDAGANRTYQVA